MRTNTFLASIKTKKLLINKMVSVFSELTIKIKGQCSKLIFQKTDKFLLCISLIHHVIHIYIQSDKRRMPLQKLH